MFKPKRFKFNHQWRLLATLFLCLSCFGCEYQSKSNIPPNLIRPDETTQKLAKKIQPSQVASIHLDAVTSQYSLTDRQTIKQLLLGLSRATEVSVKNQVCNVQVLNSQNNVLLEENFALDGPQHALSPEFIVGLRQAGIPLYWEEKARRQQQIRIALPILVGVLLLGWITTRVVIRHRTRR